MPRVCTVCAHRERPAIDHALVAGEVNRRIAAQYVVTESAIRRHKAEHLPERMVKSQEAQEVSDADMLVGEVKALRSKAYSLLLSAEKAGDLRTALLGVREARACLELLAEMDGRIDKRPIVNLTLSGEWLTVRGALLMALVPFPAARIAVADQLVRIEGTNGHRD